MGFIHEHIILPLSDLLKGEKVHRYLRFLHQAEAWDESQCREFQTEKLKELVTYVAKEVPYYRDWFNGHGMNPQEITTLEDIRKLPIVNKALMRGEGIERFAAEHFPEKQRLYSRSSGSTGEPFSFYESKLSYSVNTAAKLRTWYQAGYRLGDRYMKIANGKRSSMIKKLQDRLNNCIFIPFYSITDENLVSILRKIDETRPVFIRSYPVPLYLLAKYRNGHTGYCHSPRHIFTTGSTLPETYRNEIEMAFGCDVIDSYSCEGTPNTYETLSHDGYHVSGYYGLIEVLDNNDKPITDGIGRVVSTDFWNLAQPFVRYDTQDLVEVCNGQIQRIMGRECDAFVHTDGTLFTVHNFSHYFLYEIKGVDTYQIVKHKDDSIVFRLVVNNQYTAEIEHGIIDFWQQQLGVSVNVQLVDEIPLMNNNKRLTIVEE